MPLVHAVLHRAPDTRVTFLLQLGTCSWCRLSWSHSTRAVLNLPSNAHAPFLQFTLRNPDVCLEHRQEHHIA
jgi:hypothetical protein